MKILAFFISVTLMGCLGPFSKSQSLIDVWISNQTNNDFYYKFASAYADPKKKLLESKGTSNLTIFKREKHLKGLPQYMKELSIEFVEGCTALLDRQQIERAVVEHERNSFVITITEEQLALTDCE